MLLYECVPSYSSRSSTKTGIDCVLNCSLWVKHFSVEDFIGIFRVMCSIYDQDSLSHSQEGDKVSYIFLSVITVIPVFLIPFIVRSNLNLPHLFQRLHHPSAASNNHLYISKFANMHHTQSLTPCRNEAMITRH